MQPAHAEVSQPSPPLPLTIHPKPDQTTTDPPPRCGIDTGLFLNIRKCCVLYLHNQNGSFNPAPYLDKYGEPDAGLRRGRQLFLNQKRYDALYRNVWLQQGIPTTIARKLEADINNGGWETM